MQELEILKQLKHPNIISLIDSFCEDEVLILVMEYCESKYLIVLITLEGDLM